MEIQISNLKKQYGQITAVDIPALTIHAGEIVGLIGPNGSGKTTLLRLILDLVAPTEGQVCINGQDVRRTMGWKSATAAYLDEGFLIPFLTPHEYLNLVGVVYGLKETEIQKRLAELAPFLDPSLVSVSKYLRELSDGNRQRVGLAAALLVHPQLMVLDEPFVHLDPEAQQQLRHLLLRYHQKHRATLIFSSHHLHHVVGLAQRVLAMQNGSIVRDGALSPEFLEALKADFALKVGKED